MTEPGRELFSESSRSLWERIWDPTIGPRYQVSRFLILRLLGLVYFVAFWTLLDQGPGLIGSEGLTPFAPYLERVENALGSRTAGFLRLPTLLWLQPSDAFLARIGWVGAGISLAVLFGYANAVLLSLLWFLYMSVVHVGQTWYSFGWEIQLLETGFLAIFLCPLLDGHPFPAPPPPLLVIWLYRWLIVRIMLGAGLIKLRGDPCWSDLTCLIYHYETQPVPNPLSPWLHFMPVWFHKAGVLVNHLCELVAPLFVFGPRRARHAAGILLVGFQVSLILSGNLSFLNWLTIVPAIACFDDSFFGPLAPARTGSYHRGQQVAVTALVIAVAFLSVNPVANLLSSRQAMNTSFDRLHLVNTYGAFGSVGRERFELVFEGEDESGEWREYEFKCKPTDVFRRPCILTPYHYRLDWLLWFAAMGRAEQYPWTVHLVWKLLHNDPATLDLMGGNPFAEEAPRAVRVELYRYRFAPLSEEAWWERERVGPWLPALSVNDARLTDFLRGHGYVE